ncbi:hypothetical protein QDT05_15035 [Acinetobacter baumannii]|uniref:hypothetical protein n=1 Tax=Acinetobacter baumannii TaxID=470 RepID=UPI00244D084C|nr:hypothetical protein [Acinetobacter baumannii]MDH2604181.1 hypothetical protein [Acinetobacter baumannii]
MPTKIFVLDKNIISLLNDDRPKESEAIKMLQYIRRHDRKAYRFSALSSIMEGRLRRKETEEEIRNTITIETKIMKNFFKNVKTDSEFFKNNNFKFAQVFSNNSVLIYEQKYKAVIKKYYERWDYYSKQGSIPKTEMAKFAYEIIEYVEELKLPRENPIILLLIIDIFQKTDSKFGKNQPWRILHPNKKIKDLEGKVHNVYSDLIVAHLLSRLNFAGRNEISIQFLTLDNALKNFLHVFELNHQNIINCGFIDDSEIRLNIKSEVYSSFILKFFEDYDQQKIVSENLAV